MSEIEELINTISDLSINGENNGELKNPKNSKNPQKPKKQKKKLKIVLKCCGAKIYKSEKCRCNINTISDIDALNISSKKKQYLIIKIKVKKMKF